MFRLNVRGAYLTVNILESTKIFRRNTKTQLRCQIAPMHPFSLISSCLVEPHRDLPPRHLLSLEDTDFYLHHYPALSGTPPPAQAVNSALLVIGQIKPPPLTNNVFLRFIFPSTRDFFCAVVLFSFYGEYVVQYFSPSGLCFSAFWGVGCIFYISLRES